MIAGSCCSSHGRAAHVSGSLVPGGDSFPASSCSHHLADAHHEPKERMKHGHK